MEIQDSLCPGAGGDPAPRAGRGHQAPGGWNSAWGKEGMRRKLITALRSLWKSSNSISPCQGSSAFHPSLQEFLSVEPFLEHPPHSLIPNSLGGKPTSESSREAAPGDFVLWQGIVFSWIDLRFLPGIFQSLFLSDIPRSSPRLLQGRCLG